MTSQDYDNFDPTTAPGFDPASVDWDQQPVVWAPESDYPEWVADGYTGPAPDDSEQAGPLPQHPLTTAEKVTALADFFGISREEAAAELVDMGEIDEDEDLPYAEACEADDWAGTEWSRKDEEHEPESAVDAYLRKARGPYDPRNDR
jgi:hypothetical protein